MTTVILFHSALGLRPSIKRMADHLRSAGHEVHTPDLFDGRVFDDLDAGAAHRDRIGIPELSARTTAAVEELPRDVVYAGLSMGSSAASFLALHRPGAVGLVVLHGVPPAELVAGQAWPGSLPVLVHRTLEDRWVDPASVEPFHQMVPTDLLEEHVHPGNAHLYTDEDSPDYEPALAAATAASMTAFVSRLG